MHKLGLTGQPLSRPGGNWPLHVWIYNHPFRGISDQLDSLLDTFRQAGYRPTIGRQPRADALNIVIENFSPDSRDLLIGFCRAARKRVAILMTEHIDFIGNAIRIHGNRLHVTNDYMNPATQIARISHLMECLPYISCFMTLGDLPELINIDQLMPGVSVIRLPFPRLAEQLDGQGELIQNDLVFTGASTAYREKMLRALRSHGITVMTTKSFVSRNRRNALNRASKIAINIPQRDTWRWLSPMRIYAALRCDRATISVGTQDTSVITPCCPQIPAVADDWPREVTAMLDHWQALYRTSLERYNAIAASYEEAHPFPHAMLDLWAIMDGLAPAARRA